jgi:hypothetical protein
MAAISSTARRFLDLSETIWRYTTAVAVSLLIGLIVGQYQPNRSVVTTDQLNAATTRLETGQANQETQIEALTTQVAVLTAELKLQNKIR